MTVYVSKTQYCPECKYILKKVGSSNFFCLICRKIFRITTEIAHMRLGKIDGEG